MRALICSVVAISIVGCASHSSQVRSVESLRASHPDAAQWLISEMISPGGDGANGKKAREALGNTDSFDWHANFARAVYDEAHGQPEAASRWYAAALRDANVTRGPLSPLVAWFSVHQLASLRGAVTHLYKKHKEEFETLLVRPTFAGWRALAELNEWRAVELFDGRAEGTPIDDRALAKQMGCATSMRIAGPFGRGNVVDRYRPFPAEAPGPWPAAWPADPTRGVAPKVLETEQHRCLATTRETAGEGVYYAETYFDSPNERAMIIAVQGATKIWVDDWPVTERDMRQWGAWHRFGVQVQVKAGRHRLLARIMEPATSIRILDPNGVAADLPTDTDARRLYTLSKPEILADPNPLDDILASRRPLDPLARFLSSEIAHIEAMDDVASSMLEPLVTPPDAAPIALEFAAVYARGDVARASDVRRADEKSFRARALARDPGLWATGAWIALNQQDERALINAIEPLRKLSTDVPKQPDVLQYLADVYTRLGWRAERMRTLVELTSRFPEHLGGLHAYLAALDDDGEVLKADEIAVRIHSLDPDSDVAIERALGREDWQAAITQLRAMQHRHPDRKEIAGRIADILERSGDMKAAVDWLTRAVRERPDDSSMRFQLADREFARGDKKALRRALGQAIERGAKTDEIVSALDLIEGVTNFEPHRLQGDKVIQEFNAWERAGHKMSGTAARVLDYAVLSVSADGSSEMLEHEIVKIQSQEAVASESEQAMPEGLVLRLRVIKPDGKTLEPERVSGKPTLTMPHLEVGDFVEIEHVTRSPSDGQKGKRFRGPRWFFREADRGYWRSEFVAIAPKDREIEIEVNGEVPQPTVSDRGAMVERRWRVDLSPAAIVEPDSAPIVEFLPTVRIGWGVSLEDTVARVVDTLEDTTPIDPRFVAQAREIVKKIPSKQTDARARAIYRFVADAIEEGGEADGRRAINGKSGSRQSAFVYLLRALNIPVDAAVVRNRLAPPPVGKMHELENWDNVALRIETDRGVRWLSVRDKFAPFGYLPSEFRGQPAILLKAGMPRETTEKVGLSDGLRFEGEATLNADGSALVELQQIYTGKPAILMRNVLEKVAPKQLNEFVETRVLSRTLPGARLESMTIEHQRDLDEPLVIRMRADLPRAILPEGALRPFFALHLAQLATLPTRTTPLLLGTSSSVAIHFTIRAAPGVRLPTTLAKGDFHFADAVVKVNDTASGDAITLDRYIDIPAMRVAPGPEYRQFSEFVQHADALMDRDILVGRDR